MSVYYSTTGGAHLFQLIGSEATTGYSGPYVVIDPEDREAVERLALLVRDAPPANWTESMSQALREFAAPTPPRPDEPLGLGAVVEDEDGKRWTRYSEVVAGCSWMRQNPAPTFVDYADLRVVRVLSEGVVQS